VATGLYLFQALDAPPQGWWLLGLGLLLGALGQLGIEYPAPAPGPPPERPSRARFWLGGLLAMAGIGLWTAAVLTLLRGWVVGFDPTWAGWPAATAPMRSMTPAPPRALSASRPTASCVAFWSAAHARCSSCARLIPSFAS
jgi:hypothetical protein